MKDIDVLLDKYLKGETDLQEENNLKQILSEQSDIKYASYKEAFTHFQAAKKTRFLSKNFDKNLLLKLRQQRHRPYYRILQISSLSIAASIILALGLFTLSQKKEAYVIENGVRYDDMEKAVGYADEAINDAIAPLKESMQSLQPIKGLEGTLTPSYGNGFPNDSDLKTKNMDDSMLKTRN